MSVDEFDHMREQLPDMSAGMRSAKGRGVHAGALRAPFPWFGGKSRVADVIWSRLGDPVNVVEAFFGSGAVLFGRPPPKLGEELRRVETVNDLDCFLACTWRAIAAAPELVATFADRPVNEADLHSIHRWLVYGPSVEKQAQHRDACARALSALKGGDIAGAQELLRASLADDRPLGPAFRERMRRDKDYFDAEIAGLWVWGICAWIGSGWCTTSDKEFDRNDTKRPVLGGGRGSDADGQGAHHGRGVHSAGMHEKIPRLGGTRASGGGTSHGVGVHGGGMRADVHERGVHANGMRGAADVPGTRSALYETFERLSQRLRYVRVACGDWTRVLTDSVTWRHGDTGIYLDPPYSDEVRAKGLYAVDSGEVAAEVLRWCEEHGPDKRLRIALSGYASEGHGVSLEAKGWSVHAWKAKGGYGGQRKIGPKNENAAQERIWFSPGCLAADGPAQRTLFGA